MFSIKSESTLICDRDGHNNSPIMVVCMKKGCQDPIPCCMNCVTNDHKNHQQQDFVDISEVQDQDNTFLKYLNRLAQLTQSIIEMCQLWNQEILKLADQLRVRQQLGQNPTITELSNYVRRVRERDLPHRQTETVQKKQNEFKQIKERLTTLQKESKDLLKYQVVSDHKLNQYKVKRQEISNVNQIKFTLTQQLKGHDNEVKHVAISSDDKYLASSSYPNPSIVILWDFKENKLLTQYKSKYFWITALQFSKDNSMLVVCSVYLGKINRQIIEIFDLTNQDKSQAKIKLEGHEDSINMIMFTDDSNYLISVSHDRSLRLWDLQSNKEINQQNCENEQFGVTYSHKTKLIACCGNSGVAFLFDCRTLNNLELKLKWQAHQEQSLFLEFIQNSTVLMTSSATETRFWQVDDLLKQKFNHFKEIKEGGQTIKAYPLDNPQVIINCSNDDKCVYLWNYNSTELIQRLEIPEVLSANKFAITSDFKKIITGGNNKMVNIFEQQ